MLNILVVGVDKRGQARVNCKLFVVGLICWTNRCNKWMLLAQVATYQPQQQR